MTFEFNNLENSKHAWNVVIDISGTDTNINSDGENIFINRISDNKLELILIGEFNNHRIAYITNKEITLYATAGSKIPCYARIASEKLYLSNLADNLIFTDEKLSINTYVLMQNLTGTPYPQTNIFNDIHLLSASGIYKVDNNSIKYIGSQLECNERTSFDDIFEIVKHNFDESMKSGCEVNVLLSAGYDSRLNLCFALESSKRFGNHINTYHFIKDKKEAYISNSVAEMSKVRINNKDKSSYIGQEGRNLIQNPDFIRFHNGNYRDDLPRWHGLLREIEENSAPNSITFGLGAEAHKGKYYKQFNIEDDAENILGINKRIVPEICRAIGLKDYNKDSQKKFFEILIQQSKIYDRLDQRIDFMHYHTYASNGWGCRTHSISSHFSVPFPFVCHDFLKKAFLLPKDQKEDFYITKKMIKVLNQDLSNLPYISGNQPSTRVKNKKLSSYLPEIFIKDIAYYRNRYFIKPKKGRVDLYEDEINFVKNIEASSNLTFVLKNILLHSFNDIPHIRLTFTLQAFLYLTFLEHYKNVQLIME